MGKMEVKELQNQVIITINPSPKSSYSIFFYIISILLLISIIYICAYFFPKFLLAFGVALIPIALLIFNFKINIWNIFGRETIVSYKDKITSTLEYKFIYQTKTKEYPKSKSTFYVLSSKDGSKLKFEDPNLNEHRNNKFRLIMENNKEKIFQSTNFIEFEDVKKLAHYFIKK